MESPLDVRGDVTVPTFRPDQDREAGGGEPRYAGIQLEQEQEGSVATPASRNDESDTEHDKGRSVRVSASRIDESDRDTESSEGAKERSAPIAMSWHEESSTDSDEHTEGRNSPVPISRNEESETDNNSSSDGDLEIEQGYVVHKNDSSAEALDEKTLVEEEEGERDGNVYFQKEQSSPKAPADKQCEPSSSFDWVIEESVETGLPEIVDLDSTVGTPSSPTQEGSEKDKSMSLRSLNAPTEEESKPSSSQVKAAMDIGSELVEFDEPGLDDSTKAEGDYVKKGFTCDSNTEEEDEQLREYWTRALQTGTSTGQVVEEIVKVLKHHQKTHDLLCPVCGSCVTRRVILRKRKRSSLISVDRWYRDPLDEGEVREPVSSTEILEPIEEEDPQDTKAFGCLACFSLFFEKGFLLLNQLQADIGSDTFNCVPFFFPPYPWGITQMKPRSPDLGKEVLDLEEIVESEEPSSSNVITCNIGSALLPDYPWGTMPVLLKGLHEEGSSLQEVVQAAVLDVQESVMADVESGVTCGIGSTLLPDYQWGTMPRLSKGWVHQFKNLLVVPWEMKNLVKVLNPKAVETHCS